MLATTTPALNKAVLSVSQYCYCAPNEHVAFSRKLIHGHNCHIERISNLYDASQRAVNITLRMRGEVLFQTIAQTRITMMELWKTWLEWAKRCSIKVVMIQPGSLPAHIIIKLACTRKQKGILAILIDKTCLKSLTPPNQVPRYRRPPPPRTGPVIYTLRTFPSPE